MGKDSWSLPPSGAPLNVQREEHWRHFDNSVNAVSFGFVATAILISMFLVMAIFERFLRPRSTVLTGSGVRNHRDVEALVAFNGKLDYPSPKSTLISCPTISMVFGSPVVIATRTSCCSPMFLFWWQQMSVYASGVSVLMPGEKIPTFIAHPAPVPCPPDHISWPLHQHNTFGNLSSNMYSNSNST